MERDFGGGSVGGPPCWTPIRAVRNTDLVWSTAGMPSGGHREPKAPIRRSERSVGEAIGAPVNFWKLHWRASLYRTLLSERYAMAVAVRLRRQVP